MRGMIWLGLVGCTVATTPADDTSSDTGDDSAIASDSTSPPHSGDSASDSVDTDVFVDTGLPTDPTALTACPGSWFGPLLTVETEPDALGPVPISHDAPSGSGGPVQMRLLDAQGQVTATPSVTPGGFDWIGLRGLPDGWVFVTLGESSRLSAFDTEFHYTWFDAAGQPVGERRLTTGTADGARFGTPFARLGEIVRPGAGLEVVVDDHRGDGDPTGCRFAWGTGAGVEAWASTCGGPPYDAVAPVDLEVLPWTQDASEMFWVEGGGALVRRTETRTEVMPSTRWDHDDVVEVRHALDVTEAFGPVATEGAWTGGIPSFVAVVRGSGPDDVALASFVAADASTEPWPTTWTRSLPVVPGDAHDGAVTWHDGALWVAWSVLDAGAVASGIPDRPDRAARDVVVARFDTSGALLGAPCIAFDAQVGAFRPQLSVGGHVALTWAWSDPGPTSAREAVLLGP